MSLVARKVLAAALFAATALSSSTVSAETLFGALTKAYQLNSTLNYNRAGVRVTDENVPIAKSGWRPTIGASGSIDYTSTEGRSRLTTGSFGVQIDQTLFDGFQTRNNVRAAEAQVRASVESLRNEEQNTLFDAARDCSVRNFRFCSVSTAIRRSRITSI